MAVSDSNGNPYALYTMGAFGYVLEKGTSTGYSSEHGTDPQPYHLTTKEFDNDVCLYYFNARWYDLWSGRFISRDAHKRFVPYIYANQDAVNSVDPTGLSDYRTEVDAIKKCRGEILSSKLWKTWKKKQNQGLGAGCDQQAGEMCNQRMPACLKAHGVWPLEHCNLIMKRFLTTPKWFGSLFGEGSYHVWCQANCCDDKNEDPIYASENINLDDTWFPEPGYFFPILDNPPDYLIE
jgi:RHS repeat-associated protein